MSFQVLKKIMNGSIQVLAPQNLGMLLPYPFCKPHRNIFPGESCEFQTDHSHELKLPKESFLALFQLVLRTFFVDDGGFKIFHISDFTT